MRNFHFSRRGGGAPSDTSPVWPALLWNWSHESVASAAPRIGGDTTGLGVPDGLADGLAVTDGLGVGEPAPLAAEGSASPRPIRSAAAVVTSPATRSPPRTDLRAETSSVRAGTCSGPSSVASSGHCRGRDWAGGGPPRGHRARGGGPRPGSVTSPPPLGWAGGTADRRLERAAGAVRLASSAQWNRVRSRSTHACAWGPRSARWTMFTRLPLPRNSIGST